MDWSHVRRSTARWKSRSASASKPQVSIEAGIAKKAMEKHAVRATTILVYLLRIPSHSRMLMPSEELHTYR
jgi:hypothetical protein|eukprot:COSAG01_NODE_11624_length_1893_cov_1.441472_2_plen_71_part_00